MEIYVRQVKGEIRNRKVKERDKRDNMERGTKEVRRGKEEI